VEPRPPAPAYLAARCPRGLPKGVRATTAIGGNTLSEEQVVKRIEGELELPPSKEHLGKEIDNIVEACRSIVEDVKADRPLTVTADRDGRCRAKTDIARAFLPLRRPGPWAMRTTS
jgi:hypothetical protein